MHCVLQWAIFCDIGGDVYEKIAIRCNLKIVFMAILFKGRQCTNDTQIGQYSPCNHLGIGRGATSHEIIRSGLFINHCGVALPPAHYSWVETVFLNLQAALESIPLAYVALRAERDSYSYSVSIVSNSSRVPAPIYVEWGGCNYNGSTWMYTVLYSAYNGQN